MILIEICLLKAKAEMFVKTTSDQKKELCLFRTAVVYVGWGSLGIHDSTITPNISAEEPSSSVRVK